MFFEKNFPVRIGHDHLRDDLAGRCRGGSDFDFGVQISSHDLAKLAQSKRGRCLIHPNGRKLVPLREGCSNQTGIIDAACGIAVAHELDHQIPAIKALQIHRTRIDGNLHVPETVLNLADDLSSHRPDVLGVRSSIVKIPIPECPARVDHELVEALARLGGLITPMGQNLDLRRIILIHLLIVV